MVRHPDILSGPLVVAAGLALAFLSNEIDINPAQATLTARFLPMLGAVAIVLCGIGITVRGVVAARAPLPFIANARVAVMAVLFLAYFLTFEYVDFRLGAWALMLLGMLVLGARRPLQLVLTPALVSAAVYLTFRYGFTIILPVWT